MRGCSDGESKRCKGNLGWTPRGGRWRSWRFTKTSDFSNLSDSIAKKDGIRRFILPPKINDKSPLANIRPDNGYDSSNFWNTIRDAFRRVRRRLYLGAISSNTIQINKFWSL